MQTLDAMAMQLVLSAVLGTACLPASPRSEAAETDRRPNVLLICLDDMNDWVGHLGGYGGAVHTPHIDRLAAEGVAFTNAHCDAPVCNPSRTAVFTGLRPSTTGVYDNGHWWRPHLPGAVTLPEHFKAHGYRVEGGGKVLHHTLGFNPPGLWDLFFPRVSDNPWHYRFRRPGEEEPVPGVHWPEGFPLNGLESVRRGDRPPANYREFDWGPLDRSDAEMGDAKAVEWASKVLRAEHTRPFLLAVGIFRPHMPWYVPRRHFDLYPMDKIVLPRAPPDDLEDVPPAGRKLVAARTRDFDLIVSSGQYRRAVGAYLASISFADALVGLLLDALREGPNAEDTVVLLWSDHGWHLGEKRHWHKMTLWERATRVPLVCVAPGVTRGGGRSSRPVNLVDIYPTLVELCGLPAPKGLDGESLVPLLRDPRAPRERPAITTYLRGNHAVRSERWRYIRYADGGEELYDHARDPGEIENLASDPAFEEVRRDLSRWLPARDAPEAPPKSAWRFDPETYTWTPAASER